MKNIVFNKAITLLIIASIPTLGIAASKSHAHPAWTWILNNFFFVIAATVVIAVLLSLWNLMNAMLSSHYRELGIEGYQSIDTEQVESPFSKLYDKLSGLVPIEKENDIMLDHDYDGIKELDNSLPPWWLYGFYISIVVSLGYLYVYEFSDIGLSQQEEYVIEIEKGEEARDAFAAKQANNIDEKNLIALVDAQSISVGMRAFKANCAACHGQEGQGGVGPNLTDPYWIHGGSTASIYKTIKYGVPEKGMIAWKTQMQPIMIHKISSYIKTIQGTNPPNPKKKQGVLYEEISTTN